MAHAPNHVWKAMNSQDRHRFAVVVFFFAAIGPMTMLMDQQIVPA